MRFLCLLFSVGLLSAQEASPTATNPGNPPKPGVPGVQHPMSNIVPDAEYAIPNKGGPDWLAMGDDQVWTNSRGTGFVYRMDPWTNKVVAEVAIPGPCSGLIIAYGTLWVPSCPPGDEPRALYRIDSKTNKIVAKLPVGPAHNEGGIAHGAGSVWLPSDPAGVVSRIDPETNKLIAEIKVAPGSFTAVFGYGMVWVSSTEKDLVSVIHPASNKVIAEIQVDPAPRFMTTGEGYVWTLNQKNGTVTKIDPLTKTVVATIEVGVPGGGGDISAGEGAVWVTARTIPVSRIDPTTNKVTHQFTGSGGDAIRVLHGSVWLSNGRWGNVWRFRPEKVLSAAPTSWTNKAQPADLDADGKTDLLVEDMTVWLPGDPATFHMKVLNPGIGDQFVLKAKLNDKMSEIPFKQADGEWLAVFTGGEPQWIHYSVCVAGKDLCSTDLVTASPTTPLEFAKHEAEFVPADFMAPGPPVVGDYVWNILEPIILDPDYQALVDRAETSRPLSITKPEDYGELKRHEWEFQNHTAFGYGILTPDKTEELACVYINPSPKEGYDAKVTLWVTKQGAEAGLEPVLEKTVREWVATKWPFKNVAYPGRDVSTEDWNALPDASE